MFLRRVLYQFSQTRLYLFILSTHCSQPPKCSPFLRCRSGLYNITIYNYRLFSPYQTLQTSIAPSLSPVSSFPLILLLGLFLYLLCEYSFLSSSFCSTPSRSIVVSPSDFRSFPPFHSFPSLYCHVGNQQPELQGLNHARKIKVTAKVRICIRRWYCCTFVQDWSLMGCYVQ